MILIIGSNKCMVLVNRKRRGPELYCIFNGDFSEFLGNLPMATPFAPFSNLEGGLVTFLGGSTLAASTSVSGSLVSKGYQYLSGMSYCSPYCLALSYIVSVGIGSASARSVSDALRSHFLENYKEKWLLENQGKYYVENNVLRRVPVIPASPSGNNIPEGLAFISLGHIKMPSTMSDSVIPTFLRVAVVCTISRTVLFVAGKMVQKVVSLVSLPSKGSVRGELLEATNSTSGLDSYWAKITKSLDGIDTYHRLTSDDDFLKSAN